MPTTRTVQTPSLTAAAPTVFTADARRFGNAADSGLVSLTWSSATGMTFELYQ